MPNRNATRLPRPQADEFMSRECTQTGPGIRRPYASRNYESCPQRAEEGADVVGEQLGLFVGGEVAAARHLGPAGDLEEPLGPFLGRVGEVLGKHREARGHLLGGSEPLL